MDTYPYLVDIRSQADALRRVLDGDVCASIRDLAATRYDRLILSGMGASLFALYPAWLACVQAGMPAWWIDASELLHDAQRLITDHTLVLLASQSGRSAEITALLEAIEPSRPACVIGITNTMESPLGRAADRVVPILAGAEHAVSTRSYINTLVVTHLVVRTLADSARDVDPFWRAADVLDRYLGADWEQHMAAVDAALGHPERLVILGRGPALATAWQGALVLKEAAKMAAEGLGAAQFRHGPLELADTRLTAIVVEGAPDTAHLNRRLAVDLTRVGASVVWVGAQPPAEVVGLPTPQGRGAAREVVDIVPLEMASVALAVASGLVPGEFRYSGKVTTTL